MKRILAFTFAVLWVVFALGCTNVKTGTDAPASAPETGSLPSQSAEPSLVTPTPTPTPTPAPTPAPPSTPTPTPTPAKTGIYAVIHSEKNGYDVEERGENSVQIKGKVRPAAGDVVTARIDGNYLKVKANGLSTVILYLKDGEFSFTMPANASVFFPENFVKSAFNFTFSIPSEKELTAERNLAIDPYDAVGNQSVFPHADTNNIYDQSGQFIARNAIDGFFSNKGHGNYPYQSWGPKDVVRATDYFTIDLGRETTVTSVVLYLRADGFGSAVSHDAYFSTIVLEFSDGSTETIHPQKIADAQTFTFDAHTTGSVKLTGFVTDKSGSSGWAAITELKIMGTDSVAE